jgi:hypothetical protein
MEMQKEGRGKGGHERKVSPRPDLQVRELNPVPKPHDSGFLSPKYITV